MSTISNFIAPDERAGELACVSHAVVKKDARGLLQGRAVYTNDLAPRDSYIVSLLRSPHAHARIRSIDTHKAERIDGIVAIYTYEDVPHERFTLAGQSFREMSPYDTLILDRTVRYIGDEVAIVVGTDERAIAAAKRLIKVDYEVLPAVTDFTQALDNPVVVHDEDDIRAYIPMGEDFSRNLICHEVSEVGDLDSAFAASDVIIEHDYETQAAQQSMMEPFSCYAYTDAQDRVCVVSSTQVPFHIRRQVATALQIPQSRVRVTKPRVGGGFGAKQTGCNEIYAAFAAFKLGHPCKCIYTREETMACANTRHKMRMHVRLGAKSDGTIMAIDLDVLSDAGAYGYHAPTTVGLAGHKSLPIYNHARASRFSYDVVYTNTTPGGAFRGYGATQGQFAVESAVNELADKLGIDPCELRLANIVHEGETCPQYYNEVLRSCRLDDCIVRAKEMIGWDDKPLARDLGDRVRALGVALTMQGSGISNVDIGSIDIRLEDDGFFVLNLGATDVGTGCDTIMAQFAAEVLGCSPTQIVVNGVDTDTSPYDCGAYASSGTYVTGMAAVSAATKLREKICEQAAKFMDVAPEQVIVADGRVFVDDGADDDVVTVGQIASGKVREMTLGELANRCIGIGLQPGYLSAHASNSQPVSPPPFMCGIAEVDVDKATGEVTVVDYVAAVDCGTVANANLARVQAEGGIVQGIGMALTEDVQVAPDGFLRTRNLMQYKIPSRLDVPDIRIDFCPSYEPTGPFGAKSIGEVVINTPLGAIASAVAHATGNYVRTLPITPEKALFGEE
ncbi:xanthine dehydrogenase family protein molybdopterin-binding subunit [uncultured Parolsenella sp.]|uniref:xanthine dehydrogenase family protein molybdopterin-binding subunit n=1 Tax=uncultured Parolsenella sp. TaxID=2083008 RepID=UPI002657CF7C|nr:molybdopterin cofactor-binding domain-containing protein [uncultured Parolsenella sp.]